MCKLANRNHSMSAKPDNLEPLRIGHMPYTNSLLYYARLPSDEVELVTLPPRNMADAMKRGELDAGPLPIYEVLKQADFVTPVGPFGVATIGPAKSVLLFSQVACEELSGKSVAVTSHTSTSVQLLRILMADLWQVDDVELTGPGLDCDAVLLIGDGAMEFRREDSEARERYGFVYDLGEEWMKLTGQPFVFACWVAWRDSDIERIFNLLHQSFEHGIAHIDELAAGVSIKGYNADEIYDYIAGFIYTLGDQELAAIEEFRNRLVQLPVWEPPVMPYTIDDDPIAEAART